ncbi:unnamed protein product, partial [Tenebrio molitor]
VVEFACHPSDVLNLNVIVRRYFYSFSYYLLQSKCGRSLSRCQDLKRFPCLVLPGFVLLLLI